MQILRHWVWEAGTAKTPRGESVPVGCWGGSDRDPTAARAEAAERLRRLVQRIERGEDFPDPYSYGSRPVREEILRELPADAPDEAAVLTRNRYGSIILNTPAVGFIDVDLAPPRSPPLLDRLPRFFSRLLGREETSSAGERAGSDPVAAARQRLCSWLDQHPDWAVRVYRTAAGLRYLVTHRRLKPDEPEVTSAMEQLGADPRYVQLCCVQQSFRARLTPKPWRCRVPRPPVQYPYRDEQAEGAMRQWENRYSEASRGFTTCRWIESLGSDRVDPAVEPIIHIHDEFTGIDRDGPLG